MSGELGSEGALWVLLVEAAGVVFASAAKRPTALSGTSVRLEEKLKNARN